MTCGSREPVRACGNHIAAAPLQAPPAANGAKDAAASANPFVSSGRVAAAQAKDEAPASPKAEAAAAPSDDFATRGLYDVSDKQPGERASALELEALKRDIEAIKSIVHSHVFNADLQVRV